MQLGIYSPAENKVRKTNKSLEELKFYIRANPTCAPMKKNKKGWVNFYKELFDAK